MNFVNFMRKIEGIEQNDTTNSTTTGPRSLNLQGIIEFVSGLGYSNCNLEARPYVPDHRADMFWAGYDGVNLSTAMGMYRNTNTAFYWSGRAYQQQQGDTHSEQQDTVPVESPAEYAGSDRIASRYNTATPRRSAGLYYEWGTSDTGRPTMGGATPSAQPREEPTRGQSIADEWLGIQREINRSLREALDREEGGVPSVRDEREGSERSPENSIESYMRSLERGTGW